MSRCTACGRIAEPPTIQGMKLNLPTGWAVLTWHRQPTRSLTLCIPCVRAVDDTLAACGLKPRPAKPTMSVP